MLTESSQPPAIDDSQSRDTEHPELNTKAENLVQDTKTTVVHPTLIQPVEPILGLTQEQQELQDEASDFAQSQFP